MAATSEVPPSISSDQSSAPGGLGARRLAPEERVAALMDGLHSILEKAVESPSRWQVLLDASASLWRYSGGNVALLMMQMAQRGTEEPTLVAGYKEWERHGRTVLRGEHAFCG
ncbi:ArdC family protein [Arthrobacter sp.]|uniref:ArdC family protein n=1 Tax=Arthrobacter sp. TaxID=1667 RepID=UPI002811E81E|nr:ArdC family protein [Arthrobacter sp.]